MDASRWRTGNTVAHGTTVETALVAARRCWPPTADHKERCSVEYARGFRRWFLNNPMAAEEPNPLLIPVATLRGVGAERSAQLARLGVHTIQDLLLLRPRRYEDRTHFRRVGDLHLGDTALIHGHIAACGVKRWSHGRQSLFLVILDDGSGRLHCRWWNQPYLAHCFRQGDELLVYGKVSALRPIAMDHPETEVLENGDEAVVHVNRVVPVYPLTEGLSQRWLRGLVWRTLESGNFQIPEPHPEPPPPLPGQPPWPSRNDAIRMLHFPATTADAERARQRLALDELLELQREIHRRRQHLQSAAHALSCAGDNHLIRPFLQRLGFTLTSAQTRVLREIRHDLAGPQPMRRLLQGDVGSGKTVVAACAALMALESHCDVALMAPTEILAEQHYRTFSRWLEPLGLRVHLRTGSRKTDQAPDDLLLARSPAVLTIGTHALIEEGYTARRLGLVLIDEQHRFGVAQREALVRKGHYPHVLVLTATPIPRTLGLTLYGDLDISVIDQSPAGRGRVRTFVREAARLPKVWDFVRAQLRAGRQAYLVYPRIEVSHRDDLKAVTRSWEQLRAELAPFPVGLLHGRLRSEEKDRVLEGFRRAEVAALVTTSVVEVGIDVPNATVMVIEDADAFGLAQLHQLRGRIGRGAHESFCVLIAREPTEEARRRLAVLEATSDGFRIAEEDLRLRGPGELLGQQQSGLPSFRFTDLATDLALVEWARQTTRR